ncbi:MAG: nucleotide pyrophosphatase/phosphodiesterase family protein, partial [Verrucomicrobiota bacterium]
MRRLVVLEIPGLSRSMAERYAPGIRDLGPLKTLAPERPALTLPAHASLMTGLPVTGHGVVANGWFQRDRNEVMMWPQGEGLVSGEKVWEAGKKRHPDFTCLKHFWWPGMGSTTDIHTNVRPAYFADGRKSGDLYTNRPGLAAEIQSNFGPFPLFKFWGPGANIESSRWIARSGAWLFERFKPTLSLIYLPHLDYRQQTHGPDDPSIAVEVTALDEVVSDLVSGLRAAGAEVMVLSSYTMQAVSRPVHLNRVLREAGLLRIMENPTGELIDLGMSEAFAVSDHQIAHVYVKNDPAPVRQRLESLPGVAAVHEGIHPNQGD